MSIPVGTQVAQYVPGPFVQYRLLPLTIVSTATCNAELGRAVHACM